MRSHSRPPIILAFASLSAVLAAQAAGCGGGGSVSFSAGTGGASSSSSTTTSGSSSATTTSASSSSTTSASSSGGGGGSGVGGGAGGGAVSSSSSTGTTTSSSSSSTGSSSSSTGSSSSSAASSSSSTGGGAVCGNGVLDPGEQCDDGNTFDLDGCDSHCKYEMVARMTNVAISGTAAPSFCTPATNALGTKVIANTTALNELNNPLQADVTAGTLNVLTQFTGLTDLTGTSASGFSIGVVNGLLDPAKGTWPTTGNPIDWWFLADHTTISMGLPTGLVTGGALANHALTAGPSNVFLTLVFGGAPAVVQMRSARIAGTIAAATDTPAPPPTLLQAGLEVFETITANAAGQGLCGNITVASLSQIPVPQALTTGTTTCAACTNSHTYTYCGTGAAVGPSCNSLLDVLVGGCGVIDIGGNCLVAAVNPSQPDVPASTTVMKLSLGTNNKVAQNVAGDDDAYSAYLTFTANRAHFTGETCTVTTDCQTGKTCPTGGGTCQ
jgi:cysteine-rich repeat protein